ncbi:MAG TPA: CbiX/SirB N-terminal domain-containing protein [Streptosporangiaceae bacterium]|nr:CbiX/SirB N-terminal domain-containing protein [Streptosporangiaceae bacterium]
MSEILIGVAHGSKDPRAAEVVDELLAQVRVPATVRAAYLGHAVPSLPQVLSSVSGSSVSVVPLLLTAAYHSKVDIPRVLPPGVRYGDVLGPHPALHRVLDRRLAAAGAGPRSRLSTAVVLAAAGSSDLAAAVTVAQFAARWRARSGWREVVPAYASAASPTVAEAVSALHARGLRRVVVATYLLAPGYFADRIRAEAEAAGAVAVSDALGAAPELAEIVAERYLAAQRHRSRAA